jgi:transmembrane sensor
MARIDDLLEKYRRDDMAGAELEEFLALLEADASSVAAPILADLRSNAHAGRTDPAQRARMLARILEQNRGHKKAAIIKMIWRAAAAAAILLIAGAAWFLYLKPPRTEIAQTQEDRFKNDIPPGHQGATLTLSNRQMIVLDSAANGLVASDKNIEVIKKDGGISYTGSTKEAIYNYISTAKGRQWLLTLSDGSKVWLNAASSIRYPLAFTGTSRQVEISGEAYFEIAKNAKKPFIVQAGGQQIQVLGTHFNINSYPDEPSAKTTLLEGSIKVTGGSQTLILKPGEQARVSISGGLTLATGVDLTETMAWKDGVFRFRDATIEPLMRQIARWYGVDVSYQGGEIKQHFIATIPMNASAAEVFKALELTGGVHFRIDNKKITVMP